MHPPDCKALPYMSSDEKMYLLAISKECTVPECIEAMKEKFNKIYAYNTIYYWLIKSGVEIIKTPENAHRPPATRVYYSKSLVKDMLAMWNEGYNSNVIAEELTRKYNEPITPCAIQHKIARLRKNSDHTIRVKRNTKPTKVKAQKATPKVEAKPVSPVVQTTPVIQEGTEITANMFGKINNMFENVEKEFMLRKKSGLEIYFGW